MAFGVKLHDCSALDLSSHLFLGDRRFSWASDDLMRTLFSSTTGRPCIFIDESSDVHQYVISLLSRDSQSFLTRGLIYSVKSQKVIIFNSCLDSDCGFRFSLSQASLRSQERPFSPLEFHRTAVHHVFRDGTKECQCFADQFLIGIWLSRFMRLRYFFSPQALYSHFTKVFFLFRF